jgi:DNA-binding transcriptional ArsR family regulator
MGEAVSLTFNESIEYHREVPTRASVPPGPTVTETFRALGDPVRLAIVEHLGHRGDATVNELAALFPISLQAVSKHIEVLEMAGVVGRRREGRTRPVRLEQSRLSAATNWLESRRLQLESSYGRLDEVLADLQKEPS